MSKQHYCQYCGNFWLGDGYGRCKSCGAPGEQAKRAAPEEGMPTTIEDLQTWYRTNDYPSEETTGFYLGKKVDLQDVPPKRREEGFACIYQEADKTIIYVYDGRTRKSETHPFDDEAKAVCVMCLRIVDEKKQQQARHEKRRPITVRATCRERQIPPKVQLPKIQLPQLNINWQSIAPYIGKVIIFLVLASLVLGAIFGIGAGIKSLRNNPKTGYYYLEDDDLYYNDGYNNSKQGYEWWKYNKRDGDWECFSYMDKRKAFPAPLSKKSERSMSLPFDGHAEYTKEYDIKTSHGYIDVHHSKPTQNYYICNGYTYYFLDDSNGSNYGTVDHTGWYIYNISSGQWEFYAPYDDKESVNEALWYDPVTYSVPISKKDAAVSNFEDTIYYQEYESANYAAAHQYDDNDSASNNNGGSGWNSGWGWDDYSSSSSNDSDWGSSSSSDSNYGPSSSYDYDSSSSYDYGGSWDYGDSGWDSSSTDWGSGWDYDYDSSSSYDYGGSWDYGDSGWDSSSTDWGSGWDYDYDSSSSYDYGGSWDYGDSGWDSSSTDWGSGWDYDYGW